jgi:hypothetical protein
MRTRQLESLLIIEPRRRKERAESRCWNASTYIKHLLTRPGNSSELDLTSETIPGQRAKLGNQISARVPGRFAKISQSNSHGDDLV